MKRFLAIVLFAAAIAGCVQVTVNGDFSAPQVMDAEAVATTSDATLTCTLSSARVESCGFVYWIPGVEPVTVMTRPQGAFFSIKVENLQPEMTYKWYAFATAGRSEIRSEVKSFTTEPLPVTPQEPEVEFAIPDAGFKRYLVQHYDSNGDGDISEEEARSIREIDLRPEEWGITSLEGIEFMPNLQRLICMGEWTDNGPIGTLRYVDVSHNVQLRLLNLSHNKALGETIGELDLSNNVNLQEICLRGTGLKCPEVPNPLELLKYNVLDFRGSAPDFSDCTRLKELVLNRPLDAATYNVDVSNCPYLERLEVMSTSGIISDISLNPNLEYLLIWDCTWPGLENMLSGALPSLVNLKELRLIDLGLKSLDVSVNIQLEELHCWMNDFTDLDISQNAALKVLDCAPMNYEKLKKLFVSPDQIIQNVTVNRNPEYIPDYTEIVIKNK